VICNPAWQEAVKSALAEQRLAAEVQTIGGCLKGELWFADGRE